MYENHNMQVHTEHLIWTVIYVYFNIKPYKIQRRNDWSADPQIGAN